MPNVSPSQGTGGPKIGIWRGPRGPHHHPPLSQGPPPPRAPPPPARRAPIAKDLRTKKLGTGGARHRPWGKQKNGAEEADEADVEPSSHFKEEIFDVLMDRVVKELNDRYTAVMEIDNNFGLLWKYLSMEDDDIKQMLRLCCEYF